MPAMMTYSTSSMNDYAPNIQAYINQFLSGSLGSERQGWAKQWRDAVDAYNKNPNSTTQKAAEDLWTNLPFNFRSTINHQQQLDEQKNQANMRLEAKSFQAGLPTMMQQRAQILVDSGKNSLYKANLQTDRNYNARGLINSGYNDASKSKNQADVMSQVSSGISDSNKDLSNVSDAKNASVAQIGLQGQQGAVQYAGQMQDLANRDYMSRLNNIGTLAQGAGELGGMLYAGSLQRPQTQVPDPNNGGGTGSFMGKFTNDKPYNMNSMGNNYMMPQYTSGGLI